MRTRCSPSTRASPAPAAWPAAPPRRHPHSRRPRPRRRAERAHRPTLSPVRRPPPARRSPLALGPLPGKNLYLHPRVQLSMSRRSSCEREEDMSRAQRPLWRRHRGEQGFTLIELLVVVAILGVLAAIVAFNVAGVHDRGGDAACRTDVSTVQAAVDAYRNGTADAAGARPGPHLRRADSLHQRRPALLRPAGPGSVRRVADDQQRRHHHYRHPAIGRPHEGALSRAAAGLGFDPGPGAAGQVLSMGPAAAGQL